MSTYSRWIDDTVNKGRAWKMPSCICSCQLFIKSEVCNGNCWKLRGLLEAATGCWQGPNMMENTLSILIIFSVQLQQTEISDRKLFIFQHGQWTNPLLTQEWSQVHQTWASCLRSKAHLHLSSNQGSKAYHCCARSSNQAYPCCAHGDLGWCIMSNQQWHMIIQNLNRNYIIIRWLNVKQGQIQYWTTNCNVAIEQVLILCFQTKFNIKVVIYR